VRLDCIPLICLVLAASSAVADDATLRGRDALGAWNTDAPGVTRLLTVADLPAISKEIPSESKVIPRPAGAEPRVPEGFRAELVASGLEQPRVIRRAPNGDLFVACSKPGEIRVLRPGQEPAQATGVFARGLNKPFGIAFHPPGASPEWMYVANTDSVVRFRYASGDREASGPPEVIVPRLPWMHHWTRDIAFSPDGAKLYLSVGSGSNVALDMFPEPHVPGKLEQWKREQPLGATWDTEEKRAAVLTYDPRGGGEAIFATGLRNAAGITIQPATGKLWCVVNERDGLGNDTPFEYATSVKEGAFYGWPWYYNGAHEDPRQEGKRSDLATKVTVPDVLMTAHTAPLQIVFYDGTMFPADWRGDAFVAMHGSWDRKPRAGYKVVRLPFDESGRPTGEVVDFMTGFVANETDVWGRPVGVAVGADGALYVTEDGNGTIWRISRATR